LLNRITGEHSSKSSSFVWPIAVFEFPLIMAATQSKTLSFNKTGRAAPSIGDSRLLDRKILKNPRYNYISPTLNTGIHLGNVKIRPDRSAEIFKRINRRILHNLLVAHEAEDESIYGLHDGASNLDNDANSTITMTTINAFDGEIKAGSHDDPSYLLLDVRDVADFAVNHIETSISYPSINVRRDQFSPQLYKFKNAKNKIIICYDFDEGNTKLALDTVIAMIQKGFDNTVLLTGGLLSFAEKYPHRIIGQLPAELTKPANPKLKATSRSNLGASINSNQFPPKTPGSVLASCSPKSVKSLRTNMETGGRISPRTRLRQQQTSQSKATR
jgi:rhodanese-related sulfurtransferase